MKFKKTVIALLCSLPLASAYAGSIVVDDNYIAQFGTVITGSFQGTVTTPAIKVTTLTPITIQNSTVTGPGDLIYGNGSNISVINTIGIATNPNQLNVQKGMFVHIDNAVNVLVQNCNINQVRFGVYINGYAGNHTSSQTIKILNNSVLNIDGRPSDGNGGYATSGSYNAHGFQLNKVQSVPNIEIGWNKMVNFPFQSQVTENINIYSSSGTSTSHILVHDNFIQGAYPANPGTDSYSGGGIITDGKSTDTADTTTAFVDVYNNRVVSTANTGISIAAGHDNTMYNNRVVSSGYAAYCTFITRKGAVGMYNWNLYGAPSTVFFNNNIHDNYVGLISNLNGTGQPVRNDFWVPGQNNQTENNVNWTPNDSLHPTIADENNENLAWQHALLAANRKVGVIGVKDLIPAPSKNDFSKICPKPHK